MAGLDEIRVAIGELQKTTQAQTDALVVQLEAIATELDQLAAQEVIDPAEVTDLANQIRAQVAQAQANVQTTGEATEQITEMVPDEPAAPSA